MNIMAAIQPLRLVIYFKILANIFKREKKHMKLSNFIDPWGHFDVIDTH